MFRRLGLALLLGATVAVGAAAQPAAAAPVRTITFTVDPVAVATADGASVTVHVTVGCPSNHQVLEAFVYVTQGGAQSNFVGIPLTCRPKGQEYTLTVPAPEGQTWAEGSASLSGFVLLIRKSETLSASPSAPVQIVIP
jgi:hypothetical protein